MQMSINSVFMASSRLTYDSKYADREEEEEEEEEEEKAQGRIRRRIKHAPFRFWGPRTRMNE